MRTPEERREALARGAQAEDYVASELTNDGYRLLARNWRGGGGELDIVAIRDGCLRFVEVKARVDTEIVAIEDAVNHSKQRKLINAAEAFLLHENPRHSEVCFLVVLVTLSTDGFSALWIDDAFDGS